MNVPNPLVTCSCTSIIQIDEHSTFAHDPSTSDVHHPNKRSSKGTYVVLYIDRVRLVRTRVVPTCTNPTWNQHFNFPLAHLASQMEFHVKDNHMLLPKVIGVATVPVGSIAGGGVIHRSFGVVGRHTSNESTLQLKISFTPCHMNSIFQSGFSEAYAVRQSYFPMRRGGKLNLYQDAHTMDGGLPEIRLDRGTRFEHGKCWEEISHALMEAQQFIYIIGWSLYHKIKLVRESTSPLDDHDLDLGECLKMKSRQGVRVAVLIWNDKASYDEFLGKSGAGVMKTHDKETRKFFKDSSVMCLLAPRYTNSTFTNFKEQTLRALYTQHQKCMIVDSQGEGNRRKLTAFLGGLDLCDGRYDTPEHRLFRDRWTVFRDDFRNPSLDPLKPENPPRQPWHDLHCKVEGPAAYDVLTNFEQRWKRASEWSTMGRWFKRTPGWEDNVLLDIQNIPFIISPTSTIPHDHPSLWVSNQDDPQNWHTQVFRSIDSGSLTGFPEDAQEAYEQNLVCDKIFVIDKSIEMTYIQAIRSAQHFIYIENQYFIGSSYAWPSIKNAGANNLIPMEIALKIASKIRAKERFAVYIVIPMWPEGESSSIVVQEILHWQRQTMQMMYQVVARELHSSQLVSAHPTDYLNFYCLGNREQFHEEGSTSGSPTSDQTLDRFMVYVHSKGMIVDDEYVILGSANINQRSLAGSRDTEIALGAYQPHFSRTNNEHPCGQVYGYRMSLWAEHTGVVEDCFKVPEELRVCEVCKRHCRSKLGTIHSRGFHPTARSHPKVSSTSRFRWTVKSIARL